MTREEIRDEARALLNDESTSPPPRFSTTKLNFRLNHVHKRVANATKVLESSAVDQVATSVREYMLPESTDILEVRRVELIDDVTDPTTPSTIVLEPTSLSALDMESATWKNLKGRPQRWYLRDNMLGFDRKPTDTYNGYDIRVEYAEKPQALDQDTDEPRYPDQYHELVIYGVVAWCKREDNDYEESQLYQGMFDKGLAKMRVEQNARKGHIFKMRPL